MRLPPAGAEPNLKPMSRARLACGASRSSVMVRAYRLYGGTRCPPRKYPPTLPAYRSAIRACSTTGSSAGCAPENANAGLPNCLSSLMSSSRELLTGPTTGGKCDENTAMIRLSPPSTGSRYTMSALVRPVGGLAWGTLSILKISSRRSAETRSPVNGENSGPPAALPGPDAESLPPLLPVSRKNPPTRIANATAELTAASSALRLIRTGHHLPTGGYHRRQAAQWSRNPVVAEHLGPLRRGSRDMSLAAAAQSSQSGQRTDAT